MADEYVIVNKSDLTSMADTVRSATDSADSIAVTNLSSVVASAISSGGTQSDWNVNDSNDPAYVKNRPFYTGDPVITEIIPENTVTFQEMEGLMAAYWPESFDGVEGQSYTISWDGTEYVCSYILVKGIPVVGNLALLGAGSDTGEPFIFINQGQWLVISTESATEHVIGIRTIATQIVKIDEKYLPAATNDIPGISKIQVRNLDTTKSYSTGEIEEIYQSMRSGSAIYLTYGEVITHFSYTQNNNFIFRFSSGEKKTIRPVDGVWDFSNQETTHPDTVIFQSKYSSYANISSSLDNGVGGNRGKGYELVKTNMAGFGGNYLQASSAIVLKLSNAHYYLYISANIDGKIEVTKRESGLASGGTTTTLFQNGDDSITLKSSTEGSTKKFKITVDDSGTISATEVTS